jgi:hypothetical protein
MHFISGGFNVGGNNVVVVSSGSEASYIESVAADQTGINQRKL